MTARKPLPEDLTRASFSVDEAQRMGMSTSRLRASDLETPFSGVRSTAATAEQPLLPFDFAAATRTIVSLAHQYSPRMKPGQFFCEMTAIALHGLPIPTPRLVERDVHVAVPFPRTPPRARGMIGHQFSVNATHTRDGLPVSAAVDAWIDCAGRCTVDELIVIGDGLLRRQNPLATGDDLVKAVRAHKNRPGSMKLGRALARIRGGTDSPKESELRLMIVQSGLPEPVVNLVIRDSAGRQVAISDLAYPEWMVAVEYQGGHHFAVPGQGRNDIDRIGAMEDANWRVIQAHSEHLDLKRAILLNRIRNALLEAGWRP